MFVVPFTLVNGIGTIVHMILVLMMIQRIDRIYVVHGHLGLCWTGSKYPQYCLFNRSNGSRPLILYTNKPLPDKYFYPLERSLLTIKIYGHRNDTGIHGQILDIEPEKRKCSTMVDALYVSTSDIKVIKVPSCKPHVPVWVNKPTWVNGTFNMTCDLINTSLIKENGVVYVSWFNCTIDTIKHPIKLIVLNLENSSRVLNIAQHTIIALYNANLSLLYIGRDTYIDIPSIKITNGTIYLNTGQAMIILFNDSTIVMILKTEIENDSFAPKMKTEIVRSIKTKLFEKYYQLVPRNIPYYNVIAALAKVSSTGKLFFIDNEYRLFVINDTTNDLYIEGLPIYYKDDDLFVPNGINTKSFLFHINNSSSILTK